MLIEDEELRGIFQEASEDGLRTIREGLTQLRERPDDQDLLEELLRESHSLKGNAGMLGLKDIATLTQQWEHLLSQVHDGKTDFSEDLARRLEDGLTALEGLVHEAITGEPSGVQTFYILAELMGSEETSSSPSPEVAETPQTPELASLPPAEEPPRLPTPQSAPEPPSDAGEIEDVLSRLEVGLVEIEEEAANPKVQDGVRQRELLEALFADLDILERLTGNDPNLQTRTNAWKQDLAQVMESDGGFETEADRLYEGLDAIRDYFRPDLASRQEPAPTSAPVREHPAPAEPMQVDYIEDEELRHTFQLASQDHLQKLYDGLLHLEQSPDDRVKLDDMLREIHSLKGDAGMLGVNAVAQLAHEWEQALAPVKSGEVVLTSERCDELLRGLDYIRQCVDQAVTLNDAPEPSPEDNSTSPPVAESRYIEDEELRQTFQVASEDHLQKLDAGLLYLETHPQDGAKLDELLREIHSIKGDAAMLGMTDMAQLAHEWEQQLLPVKEGTQSFDASLCDRLGEGIKALQQLVQEAITNSPAQLSLLDSLATLRGEAPGRPPTGSLSSGSSSASGGTSEPDEGNYRIDTIRVDTQNLDALMTTAGELTVTKIRIAHRLSEIEEVVVFWEEWAREAGNMSLKLSHPLQDELQKTMQRQGIAALGMGDERGDARVGYEGRFNGATHSALLNFARFQEQNQDRLETLGKLVNRLQTGIAEDTARLETLADDIEEGVRTLRLLPLSTIFNLYPRLVRDLARSQGKEVRLKIIGGETRADKRILEDMKDPLTHIIRNAIDHGIESPEERKRQGKPSTATITLRGYQTASTIVIEVSDDGRGLEIEKIKKTALKNEVVSPTELEAMTPGQIQNLIFMPGFSTRSFVTEVSGRGVGLDVVRANVERLKGSVHVMSKPGQGCSMSLQLGTTLATAHVLLLEVQHIYHEATGTTLPRQSYALPVEFVQTAVMIAPDDIFSLEGRETILYDNQPISVVHLADILELPINLEMQEAQKSLACILLKVGEEWLGVLVDRLIDEQDAILKPQSQLLKRVRNVSGATILGTGEVCMVLNPVDIIKSVRGVHRRATQVADAFTHVEGTRTEETAKQTLLLVEDSITTRTQEKRILEAAGYEVVTAVDGVDGYNKLRSGQFDAVVSDIQMPNLDGLELTARIRTHPDYSELPIILVTSLATDEDRRRGAEAGANAYITKSSFNQDVLVETLQRLI
ncbi:MAG: response regulator [Phormidium sp. GEM2.Bin31]|nr:Hpt domain-containing protein [Phormidium sp. BM_Day4_Bin.17]TVR09983.1 MAG: response regulator [Phormidium sp. GEM2.Bin31]UCJ11072.1 MAG: Hpt domain-containing protein [Phormidium sp. PBR-2020]